MRCRPTSPVRDHLPAPAGILDSVLIDHGALDNVIDQLKNTVNTFGDISDVERANSGDNNRAVTVNSRSN